MTEAYRMVWSVDEGLDSQLVPYFQPILALDTRRIMGYEALGRIRTNQGVQSLGPFFGDKRVPMSEQIRVDRLLREQALAKFAGGDAAGGQGKLFINLKPSWIYQTYAETGELPTLRLLDKYAIDPRNVVIEITEESFLEPMEQLRSVVDVYRQQGCLIAIDDVGSGFSNMDRIAQIQPHILKIDIHMLQKSEQHSGYYGVLRSFSTLAEQIGSSLLVEGVETELELQRAIEIGARYVQGFLFAKAEPEFRPSSCFAGLIEAGLNKRRSRMIQEERYWSAEAEKLRCMVDAAWQENYSNCNLAEAGNDFIEQILPGLEASYIRVYMCCEDGIQCSANYRREEGAVWYRENAFRGHNWSWRPYFIPLSVELEWKRRAAVSRTYTDLDSLDRIRTISVPIGKDGILFLDMTDPEGEHS
ncbi:diguanylate phosphodiesterase [Paenibacillus baekrokdamisoli]|uniref:Diguanylate phosphodiesterase n=1 Tax=Paenibacillus baekrokdamisoli TaxID=1712516 RepID=A0A3G9JJT7_9BACL|nr:EAL domain-containing protein [Paenibacillus baekrokdamisoli]MBB3073279.1 EAL domain-containing protein (putative c-di-GMP-specific phosphodiesterase class I) [Paenibacillus baekrokdamisoli]BBH23289.1 diguanylate phosphodiesterase [Paenibacillus baekrokdamisoli]